MKYRKTLQKKVDYIQDNTGVDWSKLNDGKLFHKEFVTFPGLLLKKGLIDYEDYYSLLKLNTNFFDSSTFGCSINSDSILMIKLTYKLIKKHKKERFELLEELDKLVKNIAS